MKKKSLIIIVVIIIVAVLGLMIAIMGKTTNTDKEDNKTSNTESSQTESESLIDNTEEETTEIVKDHDYYYNEDGSFDCGWDEAGITRAEDLEDGVLGYKVMYNNDGTTYLLYNKDGSRYDLLDTLPDGAPYMGTTEADQAAIHEWYMNN